MFRGELITAPKEKKMLSISEKRKIAAQAKKESEHVKATQETKVQEALKRIVGDVKDVRAFYNDFNNEDMVTIADTVKEMSKDTRESVILHQWLIGKSLSDKTFDKIKEQVDPADVEKMSFTVYERDEVTGDIIPDSGVVHWKYRSIAAGKQTKALKAGILTTNQAGAVRHEDLSHIKEIEDANITLGVLSAHKRSIQRLQAQREWAKNTKTVAEHKALLLAACKVSGANPAHLGYTKVIEVPAK